MHSIKLHYHVILWFTCCTNSVSKDQGSQNLKQRREEERKAAEASGDTRAWNSLFMRSDTVCFLTVNEMKAMMLIFDSLSFQICNSILKF